VAMVVRCNRPRSGGMCASSALGMPS
jgi:hypothetical protein